MRRVLSSTVLALLALALAPGPSLSVQTFRFAEPALEYYAPPEQGIGPAPEVRLVGNSLQAVMRPSCYVSPAIEKTYIFIRELDSDGNPLGQLGGGWVGFADQVPVISGTGKIVISYRKSSSDREYKMDPASCRGGNLISVP